jgi:hypothetical protein
MIVAGALCQRAVVSTGIPVEYGVGVSRERRLRGFVFGAGVRSPLRCCTAVLSAKGFYYCSKCSPKFCVPPVNVETKKCTLSQRMQRGEFLGEHTRILLLSKLT